MLTHAAVLALALAGWDIGARAGDAPEELDQFAFLIGCYRIEARRATEDGWSPSVEARWNGRWALDGWAVYDEWFDPDIPGQPPADGRGANLRMYDAESDAWNLVWVHSSGAQTVLRAQQRDEGLVMWQVSPELPADRKSVFEVLGDGRCVRTNYTRPYASDAAWTANARLEAFETPCDGE